MNRRPLWLGLVGLLLGLLLVLPFTLMQRWEGVQSSPYQGTPLAGPATDFTLTDQRGAAVSLSDLRGRVVVLTFLDSQCQEICPLTAAELLATYHSLESATESVAFVAVNVNVAANTVADVALSTRQWRWAGIPSWHFLTGSRAELEPVWQAYNIAVQPAAEGEELIHTPGVYLIDQEGRKRWYISTPFDASGNPLTTAPLRELLTAHILDLLEN